MSNPPADYRALQGASAYIHPFKNRTLDLSRRVRVYRNLHAKTPDARYSVLQGGLVVAHAPRLILTDVRFVVSQAAWKRSLQLGHKVVCAFAEGSVAAEWDGVTAMSESTFPVQVRFDRQHGRFVAVRDAARVVRTAQACRLDETGLTSTEAA